MTVSDKRRKQLQTANKKWRTERKKDYQAYEKRYRAALRKATLEAYGSKCVCCAETEPKFLTIDHINNDGAKHRKEIGQGSVPLMLYLKNNNYPTDSFQCLCWNCNCGRNINGGICPHKETV